MKDVSLTDIRKNLDQIIDQITKTSEPVVITRYGTPVAKIIPFEAPKEAQTSEWLNSEVNWVSGLTQETRDTLLNRMTSRKKR